MNLTEDRTQQEKTSANFLTVRLGHGQRNFWERDTSLNKCELKHGTDQEQTNRESKQQTWAHLIHLWQIFPLHGH